MNATSNFSRERRPSIPPNSSTTGDHGIEKKADAKPTRIFRPSRLGFESGKSFGSTCNKSGHALAATLKYLPTAERPSPVKWKAW